MLVDDREEGPFSTFQLRNHPRFTPDTLMRKQGSKLWRQARYIAELNILFEDEVPLISLGRNVTTSNADELILAVNQDPPFFYFAFLLALVLLAYILYRFFDSF